MSCKGPEHPLGEWSPWYLDEVEGERRSRICECGSWYETERRDDADTERVVPAGC